MPVLRYNKLIITIENIPNENQVFSAPYLILFGQKEQDE